MPKPKTARNLYLKQKWYAMKNRCLKPYTKGYEHYGGKGITIDNDWLDYDNFERDMLPSYEKHLKEYGHFNTTFDRIDGSKNYCKENCRWATWKEQNLNKVPKIDGRTKIFYQGKSLKEWAVINNIRRSTILSRIHSGWSLERAINEPLYSK